MVLLVVYYQKHHFDVQNGAFSSVVTDKSRKRIFILKQNDVIACKVLSKNCSIFFFMGNTKMGRNKNKYFESI
jgi:hypothetical protein